MLTAKRNDKDTFAEALFFTSALKYIPFDRFLSHIEAAKREPSLNWHSNYGYGCFATLTSEWWALQNTDPSSRQTGRPKWRSKYMSDQRACKIWSWAPKGGPTPRRTGRQTVGRKFNSTPLLSSPFHSTPLHSTPLHSTPSHIVINSSQRATLATYC
jgi:hypothetical protein